MLEINTNTFKPISGLFFNGTKKHFDFLAVTYVPSTCYFEEKALIGFPPGRTGISEMLPVTLPISYKARPNHFCLPVLKSVFHTLELTEKDLSGHSHITVYVTLDDKILGTGSLEVARFDFLRKEQPRAGITEIARDGLPWPGVM